MNDLRSYSLLTYFFSSS